MLTSTVPACAVYAYSEHAPYSAVQRSHVRSASYGFSLHCTRCAKGGRMLSGRLFCPSFYFRVSQN